ncbi:PspC domain-containing protein [Nocardioides marmoriginsengisoli]|nr:PspC domain-containing protein [Nocardioides marmoriginsengisoli]
MSCEQVTPPQDGAPETPQEAPQGAPQPPYQPPTYQAPPPPIRRLMRSNDDKMVAGVCGGLGRYLGVDPTLVRVGAVVALVIGFPATIVAYAVAWAIMPQG